MTSRFFKPSGEASQLKTNRMEADYYKKQYQTLWKAYEKMSEELETLKVFMAARQQQPQPIRSAPPIPPQPVVVGVQHSEELEDLQLANLSLTEENTSLKEKLEAANQRAVLQTKYVMFFGTVMGAMLSLMSWEKNAVKNVIKQAGFSSLLQIIRETLMSYVDYRSAPGIAETTESPESSKEVLYLKVLLSTVSNMMLVTEAREAIVSDPEGEKLISTYVQYMGQTGPPFNDYLMKPVIGSLYNISINRRGLAMLAQLPHVVPQLKSGLGGNLWGEGTKAMGFRLAASMAERNDHPTLVSQLCTAFPAKRLAAFQAHVTTPDRLRPLAKYLQELLYGAAKPNPWEF